jgi:hypothetical protein
MTTKPTLVVLAAGMGSRYGGLKQIDPIGPNGEIVIDYSVFDAIRAGFGKVVFVIRHDIEEAFKATIEPHVKGKLPIEYAYQDLKDLPAGFSVPEGRTKPWGTGQAVWACRNVVKEPFGIINADDFYGRNSFENLAALLKSLDAKACQSCIVPFTLRNTLSENGTVSRGVCQFDKAGNLTSVVERTTIAKDGQGGAKFEEGGQWFPLTGEEPVSMNMWGFTAPVFPEIERLFTEFLKKSGTSPKAEFYIPTVVDTLIREKGMKVPGKATSAQWFGVTYPEDKPVVVAGVKELIGKGVYGANLWAAGK